MQQNSILKHSTILRSDSLDYCSYSVVSKLAVFFLLCFFTLLFTANSNANTKPSVDFNLGCSAGINSLLQSYNSIGLENATKAPVSTTNTPALKDWDTLENHGSEKITLAEVVEHYWQWILIIFLLMFLLTMLFVRTLLLYRRYKQTQTNLSAELQERKRSEEALRLSDEILSKVGNLIIVAESDGSISYVSPSVKNILGYEPDEVLGNGWWELTFENETERKSRRDGVSKGENLDKPQYITKKIRRDGEIRWLLWTDSVTSSGQFIGVAADITVRRQTELQYAQQNEFLNGVLESVTHPFYIVNVDDYSVTNANSASNFSDLSNKPTCYDLLINRDDPCPNSDLPCPIEMIKESKKPVTFERKLIDKDGSERDTEIHSYPLFDNTGKLTHSIQYRLDITERKQAENEMRKFSQALIQSPNSIVITDKDGKIEVANPKFHETSGYTKEDLPDISTILTCQDLTETEHDEVCNSLQAGREWCGEILRKKKNGERYYEYTKISPLRNEESEIISFLIVSEDISERKKAEEALRLSDDILTKVGNIILVGDDDGNITFVSPSVKKILGYEPTELLGDDWWQQTRDDPELRRKSKQFWIDAAKKERLDDSESYINMIKDSDGTPRWILWNDSRGPDGNLISVGIDDTNRKNTENELRKLSYAIEQSPSSILITDNDGDIEYVNPKFLSITDYTFEEVVGKNPRILKSGKRKSDEYHELWETIKTGHEWRGEFHNKKKNGEIFCEYASISPIRNDEGEIKNFLKVSEDITDRKEAEKALKESEEKYRNLVERANDGIIIIEDGAIKFSNPRMAKISGYKAEETFNSDFTDFLHPDEVFKVVQLYSRLMTRDVDTLINETIIKKKDGTFRDVEFNASRMLYQGKEAVFVILRDITARKIADNALRESESKFRTLFNSLNDVIFICNSEGKITEINPIGEELLGYTRTELIGMKISELLLKPSDKKLLLKKTAKAGELKDHRIFLLKKDGTKIQAIISITVQKNEQDDEVILYQGTIRDITKLKAVEQKLRKALKENEQLFNSISSILISIDSKGIITKLNKVSEEILGISTLEVVGKKLQDCEFSWDAPLVNQGILDCKASQTTVRLNNIHFTRRNGSEGLMQIAITPTRSSTTHNVGCILMIHDLTEQRIMESQLAQAQKLESIGQLAAGIAHEINTPTQFIGDNARFLDKATHKIMPILTDCLEFSQNENFGNGKQKEFFDQIRNNVEKANLKMLIDEIPYAIEDSLAGIDSVASIVRAMKKFSHPGVDEKTATDINESLESVITISRNEWKYVAEVETQFDSTLPTVLCFPGELNQVFLNIIINAAHAITKRMNNGTQEKGVIKIATRKHDEMIEVAITDNGAGIPDEIKSKIFDPFFTTKDVGEGTGQGLAISHSVVVDKHDGTITFDTELGKGTTFFVHLPATNLDKQ